MSGSTFQFLHAADLHLDSPLRGLARRGEIADAFIEASRRALDNLVSAAISEQVAFVVIAGDLYDGDWKDYATGQAFVRQMGRLARENIKVFVLRGNHDAESVITRNLPLPANVHAFSVRAVESVRLDELKVALHGRGFAHRGVADNVARQYPPAVPGYFNIGVLHTSLTGREGHDVYAPCQVEDLQRPGYDYWALGHIHAREVVAEAPFIVFPGNLQGRHARETGPKGATLVRVTEGRVARLEPLTLDAARFDHVTLDLAGLAEPAAVIGAAREAIAKARDRAGGRPLALRLTLAGETELHGHLSTRSAQLTEELQALAWEAGDVLIERVRVATTAKAGAPRMAAITGFDGILAAVAADPAFRAEIARTLGELKARAPDEVLELLGQGGIDADAAIAAAADAVLAAVNALTEAEPGT